MGLIKHPNRAKQLIDFTGVQSGNIYPSDIDAVLEFDSKYLLLFELKKVKVQVPLGQRMMLERIQIRSVRKYHVLQLYNIPVIAIGI